MNVAGLQLRMAIAAPMKAGKSTIINYIQDIYIVIKQHSRT